jgi:hypothetical protein
MSAGRGAVIARTLESATGGGDGHLDLGVTERARGGRVSIGDARGGRVRRGGGSRTVGCASAGAEQVLGILGAAVAGTHRRRLLLDPRVELALLVIEHLHQVTHRD